MLYRLHMWWYRRLCSYIEWREKVGNVPQILYDLEQRMRGR